jgi:hypothetical protein
MAPNLIPPRHRELMETDIPPEAKQSLLELDQDVHNPFELGRGKYNIDEYSVILDKLPDGMTPQDFLDLEISAQGKATRVALARDGAAEAEQCARRIVRALEFGEGRQRMGLVKIKSHTPETVVKDPAVDALTWSLASGGFAIDMRAERVVAAGEYRVGLTSVMTAQPSGAAWAIRCG